MLVFLRLRTLCCAVLKSGDIHHEFPVIVHRVAPYEERKIAPPPSVGVISSTAAWVADSVAHDALVSQALQIICEAGEEGVTRREIEVSEDRISPFPQATDYHQFSLNISASELESVMKALGEQVFWAGYDTARVVHTDFKHEWTVKLHPAVRKHGAVERVKKGTSIWVVPRTWVNMYGSRIDSAWERAKRAVHGLIISRPGLTEVSSFAVASYFLPLA